MHQAHTSDVLCVLGKLKFCILTSPQSIVGMYSIEGMLAYVEHRSMGGPLAALRVLGKIIFCI